MSVFLPLVLHGLVVFYVDCGRWSRGLEPGAECFQHRPVSIRASPSQSLRGRLNPSAAAASFVSEILKESRKPSIIKTLEHEIPPQWNGALHKDFALCKCCSFIIIC